MCGCFILSFVLSSAGRLSFFHIGFTSNDSDERTLIPKSDRNGNPNVLVAANPDKVIIIAATRPTIPNKYAAAIYTNFNTLRDLESDKVGVENAPIPPIDTIIINIGLTMLASTAAWPKISPPIIPRVLPIGFGTLTDASFISSNDISIKINSTISGNGTFSRLAEIAISKSVGRIAWWYNITAINSAESGKNKRKQSDIYE